MMDPKKSRDDEASRKRELYLREAKLKLDDLSRRVDELETQLCERLRGSDPALQARMDGLRNKLWAWAKRLEEIEFGPRHAWTDIKAGADMAMVICLESYDKIIARFL